MADNDRYGTTENGDGTEYNSIEGGDEPPIEERLHYGGSGTALHQMIISRLMARRNLSERAMKRRWDSWHRVDEHCRLYIDLTRKAKNADGSTGDKQEMPWPRSLVVPVSYAILQVYLTQLLGIFTRRDPCIEISGVGPEDVKPAKLMNAVMAYDQVQTNYVLELYTALQDGMKYGVGGFHDCWQEEHGYKTTRDSGIMAMINTILQRPTSHRGWGKLCEYNRVEAWDPYQFFPDPRVSFSNLQYGEFCGHRLWRGYLEICAESQENGGNYFNTDAVKFLSPKTQAVRSRNRFNATQLNLLGSADERDHGFHALDTLIVELIPRDWQLGPENRPEKWQFAWVDDQVIIRAHRYGYEHGQFPYSAMESNIDTHVFGNQGNIENLDGLQRFMTWEFNSVIQNHIRHLNNRMVYASRFIELLDIENPDAAMHVRLTAEGEALVAEGRSIDSFFHQMVLTDVMGPLMGDIGSMFDFSMRMSGVADAMQGHQTKDKRTLGEVNQLNHGSSARMAMHSMMMDIQGIRPMALRWSSNRQQYTELDQYVRISGDDALEMGGDRIKIKAEDIRGNYDYVPKTGPEPPDPSELRDAHMKFLEMLGANPTIMAIPDKNGRVLDIHEPLKETLRQMGIKNPNDYYKQMQQPAPMGQPGMPGAGPQVMPDELLQQQVQAGNVVPAGMNGRPM